MNTLRTVEEIRRAHQEANLPEIMAAFKKTNSMRAAARAVGVSRQRATKIIKRELRK